MKQVATMFQNAFYPCCLFWWCFWLCLLKPMVWSKILQSQILSEVLFFILLCFDFIYCQYDHLILAYDFPFYFAWRCEFTILDIQNLFIEIFQRVSIERLKLSVTDGEILAWGNWEIPWLIIGLINWISV